MRVLIVDDHAIIRDGLRAILEAQPDIEVVGEAIEGREALEKADKLRPDVVIMDLTMPGMGGLEATRQLKLLHPDVRVMALTMHESDDYFFQVLQAGADGKRIGRRQWPNWACTAAPSWSSTLFARASSPSIR